MPSALCGMDESTNFVIYALPEGNVVFNFVSFISFLVCEVCGLRVPVVGPDIIR